MRNPMLCLASAGVGEERRRRYLQLVVVEDVAAVEDKGWLAHGVEDAAVVEISELPEAAMLSRNKRAK